jgi:hypothetical protein
MLPGFWKRSSSRRKRIITVAVFLLLYEVATVVGLMTPLSQADANNINQQIDQAAANASVEDIFGHNLILCLATFVPIGGTIFGFFSSYTQGIAMVAQSMNPKLRAEGLTSPVLVFFAYFFIPVYWLENISMSIGLAESVWLIRRASQGYGKRELRNAAVLIAIVTLILLASAILEIALINLAGG